MNGLLARHFRFLSGSLKKDIDELRKRCDKKSIHRFRVHIKKLRAFFSLIEDIEPEKSKSCKEPRKLKKLFKEAGKIHDLQVQSEILKELGHFANDFSDVEQKRKIKKAKRRFIKKLETINLKKPLNRLNGKISIASSNRANREVTPTILNFSNKNIRKAISLAENNSLHKSRMKLKTAHFCLEMIDSEPEAAALIATIDPIEQKTGRCHDYINTVRILEKSKAKPEAAKLNHAIALEISRLEFQIQKDFKRLKKIAR